MNSKFKGGSDGLVMVVHSGDGEADTPCSNGGGGGGSDG